MTYQDPKDIKRKAEQEMLRKLSSFCLDILDREGLQMPERFKIEADYPDEQLGVEAYAPGVEPSDEWKDAPGKPFSN